MKYFIYYLIVMSIIGFIQMGIDKKRAIKHRWRIPEATLFLTAFLGAGLGSWIGMYVFHHKTKHTAFVIGMPLIVVFHILCIYGIAYMLA